MGNHTSNLPLVKNISCSYRTFSENANGRHIIRGGIAVEYERMISPIDSKVPFEEYSKEQAEEYFQWFITQIEHRIQVLDLYIKKEGEEIEFDYTPASLIPLWRWYEKHIVEEKVPLVEYIQEIRSQPKWMREWIPRRRISLRKTMIFGSDIAIYFAEVVRKNSNGKIYWGYFTRPKNMEGANQPVLMGFKSKKTMEPYGIIHVCTMDSAEQKKETRLFDLYNVWREDIV